MKKVIKLTESDVFEIVKRIISENLDEESKDINEPLWNVFKIPAKIGANVYAISSNYNENTILNSIIAQSKNKWKTNAAIVSDADEDGSGYLFKYIITLIKKLAQTEVGPTERKRDFTKKVAEFFGPSEKINDEPLTKADAEMMKRKAAASDPDSFKRKGAAIFRELGDFGTERKTLSKIPSNFTKTIIDLFKSNELQFYDEDNTLLYHQSAYKELMKTNLPQSIKDELEMINSDPQNSIDPLSGKKFLYRTKRIPNESKIYKTLTSVAGYTPKKIIKQRLK